MLLLSDTTQFSRVVFIFYISVWKMSSYSYLFLRPHRLFSLVFPVHWFSNLSMHQNHMEHLRHRESPPQSLWFSGLWWSHDSVSPSSAQLMLMLLFWEFHFKNYSFQIRTASHSKFLFQIKEISHAYMLKNYMFSFAWKRGNKCL